MKIVYFTHSLASCWNHGNAHFLRGVLRELVAMGQEVVAYEPAYGWSRTNLVRDHGPIPILRFHKTFPTLDVRLYGPTPDLDAMLDGADLVVVHEWTDPALASRIGASRRRGRFQLLFHDTHHRAASDADGIAAFDFDACDGVLAFGRSVADIYRRERWHDRVFVWHEAADIALFRQPNEGEKARRNGLVWIGNWGDDERGGELNTFLLRPARDVGLPLDVYGVRYPDAARKALTTAGARYHGWLANLDVPAAFARHLATVHVPRRHYAERLPGIPTIRVFEALASGIPLVSAPWTDSERLFRVGEDFLVARDGAEMTKCLRALAGDPDLRRSLAESGLARIRSRHTCRHRAQDLLSISRDLADAQAEAVPA